MRDAIHRYLLERPSGATPGELLHLIFTQPGSDPEFGPRFVRTLLGDDPRFAFRADEGRWVARDRDGLAVPLAEARFVVVDIETTGGSAESGGITEIGAVRVWRGRLEDSYQQLVNPRQPVQPFVTRLTGITNEMLASQPFIEAALSDFLSFVGDDVLVAHNAGFDIGFLNAAMQRHVGRRLHQPHLCTVRLARRLLPAIRRRSLDALAAHFGILIAERHRALGDARATAEVLQCLLEAAARRGVRRLDELLDFQHQARDGRVFVCFLPPAAVHELPERPGVYRFFGEDERLLYIGRARSLRQRVGSYLHNSGSHGARTLDLIRHIRRVEVTETGTELEAALSEAEAIRAEQPPYNKLLKHLPRLAYLKLTADAVFPRLSVVDRAAPGGARYYGPFASRVTAERFRDLLLRLCRVRSCHGRLRPDAAVTPCFLGQIDHCSAPCAARVSAEEYGAQVARLLRILEGDPAPIALELERQRDDHAAALRFEAAGRAQRDVDLLRHFTVRVRTLGWVMRRQHFLILLPDAGGGARVYVVIAGRLVHRRRVTTRAMIEEVAAWMRAHWAACVAHSLGRGDVEAAAIIAAWLRDRGGRDGYVLSLASAEVESSAWAAALDSVLAVPSDPRSSAAPDLDRHP